MVSGTNISWDSLETIDNFDSGDVRICESTELVGGQRIGDETFMVNTPVSLLVQSLIQQLCSMLEKDHERATTLYDSICQKLHEVKLLDKTYSMGEFELIRSQYQIALQQFVKVASGDKLPIENQPSWQSANLSWSRYHRDFEELKFIAKGGFGQVFEAKHRLDGMQYAIKKICIRSSELKTVLNHLAEVKTFAALDHPNIVSYKSAWLEPLLEKSSETNSRVGESTNYSSSSYLVRDTQTDTRKSSEESDSQVCFQYSNEKAIEGSRTNTGNVAETISNCKALCKVDCEKQIRLIIEPTHLNLKWATLYIQMSLCDKTMKTWLEEKNRSVISSPDSPLIYHNDAIPSACSIYNIEAVIDMFIQLTNGLHYIHNRNIVHHDIKPSNIFIGLERNVRLGDFGLACPLQKSHHGIAIGTKQYAAPEQLRGECNAKSDLYSIGLILLEMIESYGTEMEKVQHLNELRNGKLPSHITANYPKLAHIISRLVHKKTEKRINTSELLRLLDDLKENKDKTILSLEGQIKDLQTQLRDYRESIKQKDDEIDRLRKLLELRND